MPMVNGKKFAYTNKGKAAAKAAKKKKDLPPTRSKRPSRTATPSMRGEGSSGRPKTKPAIRSKSPNPLKKTINRSRAFNSEIMENGNWELRTAKRGTRVVKGKTPSWSNRSK